MSVVNVHFVFLSIFLSVLCSISQVMRSHHPAKQSLIFSMIFQYALVSCVFVCLISHTKKTSSLLCYKFIVSKLFGSVSMCLLSNVSTVFFFFPFHFTSFWTYGNGELTKMMLLKAYQRSNWSTRSATISVEVGFSFSAAAK